MYQTQKPTAYLQPSNVGNNGNVFVEDNTVVDEDTPLLPFRRNNGSFWTTNQAMDWRIFGYDYPETRGVNTTSAQATIARLYSGSVRSRLTVGQAGESAAHAMPTIEEAPYTDWVVNTAAAPLELPPTFVVQFSLMSDSPSDAVIDVGMWPVLMPTDHATAKRALQKTEKLTKRATAADMTIHSTVSLTSSLLDQVEAENLQSLDEEDVVPFLKERLIWKVYSVRLRSRS